MIYALQLQPSMSYRPACVQPNLYLPIPVDYMQLAFSVLAVNSFSCVKMSVATMLLTSLSVMDCYTELSPIPNTY